MSSEKIMKNEKRYLEKINNLLDKNYATFSTILSLNKSFSFGDVKKKFRSKISNANENEKVILNLAFEYFIDENNRKAYDPTNQKSILKFTKFDPSLMVIINCIEYFEQNDINFILNNTDKFNRTLLYLACKCGYISLVKYFLKNGADPNITQINSSSPLHAASYYGHYEIVKLLMEAGSDCSIENDSKNLPENEAHTSDIANLILKYKIDKGYKFFCDNRKSFKNVALVFENDEIIGKRCHINDSTPTWDLSWHGTLLINIPSIIKYGFRKCGEKIDGKEVTTRSDVNRIDKFETCRSVENWAQAVFTSCSIFYSTTKAYAEHFTDCHKVEWVAVIECRIKPGTYHASEHSFVKNRYTLSKNENKNVENRSPNSTDVQLVALWFLQKKFLQQNDDHDDVLNFITSFIK